MHLLLTTGAEVEFWCYALEYIALLQTIIARRTLGWRCAHECHFGDTPDISVFRFIFWCPVWYYAPSQSFPRSKMLPGRFVGIARNVGDAFCFLILTEPDDSTATRQVIARSVVRRRFPRESPPVVEETNVNSLRFCKSNGVTVLEDPHEDAGSPLSDFVSEEKPSALPSEYTAPDVDPMDDPLRDAIAEVYGPPTKRQRVDFVNPLDAARVAFKDIDPVYAQSPPAAPSVPVEDPKPTANPTMVSEECLMVEEDVSLAPPEVTQVPHDDDRTVRDTESTGQAATPFTSSGSQDCTPEIFEDTTQHFENLAEGVDDDEGFDKIVGHTWENGILMLEIYFGQMRSLYYPSLW